MIFLCNRNNAAPTEEIEHNFLDEEFIAPQQSIEANAASVTMTVLDACPQESPRMECNVKWVDNATFLASTGGGHFVTMEGAADH